MTRFRDLDNLIGLPSVPDVVPPVLAGAARTAGATARRAAPARPPSARPPSASGPLATAVAARSRRSGTTTPSKTVRIAGWTLLAAAAANVAVLANLPFGFTDDLWFSDVVPYTSLTTAAATWGGHAILPIAASLVGAQLLLFALFATRAFTTAGFWGGLATLVGISLVSIGSAGTALAAVGTLVVLVVGAVLVVVVGIALACAMIAVLIGIAAGAD